jgi:hypothetical protein
MSMWMVICSIWAMCAMCAVLFIRGAHPHVESADDARDEPNDMGGLTPIRVRRADSGRGNA